MSKKSLLTHLIVLWMIVLSAFLGFAITSPVAEAQVVELLRDPGFEGQFVGRGRPDLNTPGDWPITLTDSPRNFDWQNRSDKVYAFPERGDPNKHSGASAQNINGGYVTFTGAVYQQVSVIANQNIIGSAWARLKTCNIGANSDNCGSAVESGAYVKVGIDPAGGTNPFASTIVWSANITPHDRWEQATVSATTTGTTATLFIFFTQNSPSQLNNVWIDDASLMGGGTGGTVPGAPTLAPVRPPAATAFIAFRFPVRPDGSIVHFIQVGDTLTGIASAYNVPISDIMELNSLRSDRFIFVGQELMIRAAGSASANSAPAAATTRAPLPQATFSPEQLAWLAENNTVPGPTPVGMGQ